MNLDPQFEFTPRTDTIEIDNKVIIGCHLRKSKVFPKMYDQNTTIHSFDTFNFESHESYIVIENSILFDNRCICFTCFNDNNLVFQKCYWFRSNFLRV